MMNTEDHEEDHNELDESMIHETIQPTDSLTVSASDILSETAISISSEGKVKLNPQNTETMAQNKPFI